MMPTPGTRVRLKSFNGTGSSPDGCRPEEDYWRLIGQMGEVVAPGYDAARVWVRFDLPVRDFGLHCHNPIENSLYILTTDLVAGGDARAPGVPSLTSAPP